MNRLQAWLGKPASAPDVPAGDPHDTQRSQSPQDALNWLTPDAITTLGNLHGAPRAVIESVIQLLPFGSRAALEEQEIVISSDRPVKGSSHRTLFLTDYGYAVIAEAAKCNEARPETVTDWATVKERVQVSSLTEPSTHERP